MILFLYCKMEIRLLNFVVLLLNLDVINFGFCRFSYVEFRVVIDDFSKEKLFG